MNRSFWRKGVILGVIAGIVWGWAAFTFNYFTGVAPIEESLFQELFAFSVGGAIFGMVLAGFLRLIRNKMPFNNALPNAILLSTTLWMALHLGTRILGTENPARYHIDPAQTFQGFFMAVMLGCILGALLNFELKGNK